jgi:ferredoxin
MTTSSGTVGIHMHITADRDRCIGAGLCAARLPDVFAQDADEGLVEVVDATGGRRSRNELDEAAYTCPSQAIKVD